MQCPVSFYVHIGHHLLLHNSEEKPLATPRSLIMQWVLHKGGITLLQSDGGNSRRIVGIHLEERGLAGGKEKARLGRNSPDVSNDIRGSNVRRSFLQVVVAFMP